MLYLDSSAIVKLVRLEEETAALRAALGPDLASSAIARTEVMRAIGRTAAAETLVPMAESVLDSLSLVDVDAGILRAAGRFPPASVRTLDAIHLSTAAEFGNELEALITYDQRMLEAAEESGFDAWGPAA